MTERMQDYRERMDEKGLIQLRIWVKKEDAEFIKHIAKFSREWREKKGKKRYGRRASQQQIEFAKPLSKTFNTYVSFWKTFLNLLIMSMEFYWKFSCFFDIRLALKRCIWLEKSLTV